ncbi:hypothetical protein [Haladaptatus sp. DYSN1]|uniref:hypothetical protein n=1 Tax=unclassified Haladaptatus TaxID=2622732 RepID=UPI00240543DE|nr:hypothetical protein [Haladaptatus sp. DYSN1]
MRIEAKSHSSAHHPPANRALGSRPLAVFERLSPLCLDIGENHTEDVEKVGGVWSVHGIVTGGSGKWMIVVTSVVWVFVSIPSTLDTLPRPLLNVVDEEVPAQLMFDINVDVRDIVRIDAVTLLKPS